LIQEYIFLIYHASQKVNLFDRETGTKKPPFGGWGMVAGGSPWREGKKKARVGGP
jgi:hypothetical protein